MPMNPWKQGFLVKLGVVLVLAFWIRTAHADSFSGKLVKVSDGDTVQVLHDGKAEKIRLEGIDCPEKAQPFGQKAKRFVLGLAAQKTVTVQVTGKDRYGRTLGTVVLPDGKNLNQELVRAGFAWHYRQYSKDQTLTTLENEAREAKRGLWVDPNPVPPWDWRRGIKQPAKAVEPQTGKYRCGAKTKCGEMESCEEAMFYFEKCGLTRLDRDKDGVPCEALCQ